MSSPRSARELTARAPTRQLCKYVFLAIAGITVLLLVWETDRDKSAPAVASKSRQQLESVIPVAADAPKQNAVAPTTAETLTGEAAKEQLRKSGHYESLGAALQAARYAAERIDPDGLHSRGAEFFAANPDQKLRAWFGRDGIELASGRALAKETAAQGAQPWSVALRLRAAGREGSLEPVSASTSSVEGNRVELTDPATAITQWFENRKEGIEQGFTLAARPEGEAREVTLLLGVEGDLRAEAMEGQQSVRFVDAAGTEVLHYTGLKAWDASGNPLPSRLELRGIDVALLVMDAGAKYPITVDPLFANVEARLNVESTLNDGFGSAVALSGDTALIGAPLDNSPAGFAVGSAYTFLRRETSWSLRGKSTAGDGAEGDNFGSSVALSADAALISAPGDDTAAGANAGSAYVFVRSGAFEPWAFQEKLIAGDGAPFDDFGAQVAFSGDTALIGASRNDTAAGTDAGSAYVFVRNGTSWSQQKKLTASDGATSDRFGSAVSLSGDSVLIGAPSDDTPAGADAGSAYVFVRSGTNWDEQAKLTASDGAALDRFGSAVALSGNMAVIGASFDDTTAGTDAGSACVFVRSGTSWSEQAKLTSDDGAASDHFGNSIAVSGERALVGASRVNTTAGVDAGAAYLFVRNGISWAQEAKLTAPEAQLFAQFGAALALTDDKALIGGHYNGSCVFVRSGTNWTLDVRLIAEDAPAFDELGLSVACSGDTALIGAPEDDTLGGEDAGSAYVFVRSGTRWVQQAKLTAADEGPGESFGISVAVSGNTALVGSYASNGGAVRAGIGHVFVRSGTILGRAGEAERHRRGLLRCFQRSGGAEWRHRTHRGFSGR